MIAYLLEDFEYVSHEKILSMMSSMGCREIFVEKNYNYLNRTSLKQLISKVAIGEKLVVPRLEHLSLLIYGNHDLWLQLRDKKVEIMPLQILEAVGGIMISRASFNDCYFAQNALDRFHLLLYQGIAMKIQRDYQFCSSMCRRKLIFLSLQEVGAPWEVLIDLKYHSTDRRDYQVWLDKGCPQLPCVYAELRKNDHFDGRGCVEADAFPMTKEAVA